MTGSVIGHVSDPRYPGSGNCLRWTYLSQDGGPKYLNSPETPIFFKAQELYGLYEARKALRNIEELMVVEGYMDVVVAQNGIVNAFATLGTATGEAHFKDYTATPIEWCAALMATKQAAALLGVR